MRDVSRSTDLRLADCSMCQLGAPGPSSNLLQCCMGPMLSSAYPMKRMSSRRRNLKDKVNVRYRT